MLTKVIQKLTQRVEHADVDSYICEMPRAGISFILLLLMIISVAAKTLLFIDYELRADFYAKNFCVKKDIPDNCCKGSCHLTKELKEQDDRENKTNTSVNYKLEVIFISESTKRVSCFRPIAELVSRQKEEQLLSGERDDLLRPPRG